MNHSKYMVYLMTGSEAEELLVVYYVVFTPVWCCVRSR